MVPVRKLEGGKGDAKTDVRALSRVEGEASKVGTGARRRAQKHESGRGVIGEGVSHTIRGQRLEQRWRRGWRG
jgi:hypothetical protein